MFYYEDDRHFRIARDADEYLPINFNVKRRAEDTGKTATFVVRVEHDRGWDFPRYADWLTDPETGHRYKDYEITLTGDQRQVVARIEILDNGILDPPGWRYWASIRQIEDANGVALSSDEEAQYWTISDIRSLGIHPYDRLFPEVYVRRVGPAEVEEGQQVEFVVERVRGNALAPLPVRVRTWEPNHQADDGTNPTEQIHTVTLPALAMTSRWTDYYEGKSGQTVQFSVTVAVDTNFEELDFLKAEILLSPEGLYDSRDRAEFTITDRDRSTITLSANATSITEGDPLVFTLTRAVNTTEDLIVGVSVDDPGGFLLGNSPSEAVTVPSNIDSLVTRGFRVGTGE